VWCLKWFGQYDGQATLWVGERSGEERIEMRRGEERRCVKTKRAEEKHHRNEREQILVENYGFAFSRGGGGRQISGCFCSPLDLTVRTEGRREGRNWQ
jgi:hypothetical protein